MRALEPQLKTYVVAGDARALAVWADIVKVRAKLTEDLLLGFLARSADTMFRAFAEEVAKYAREHKGMSIAVHSALMMADARPRYGRGAPQDLTIYREGPFRSLVRD